MNMMVRIDTDSFEAVRQDIRSESFSFTPLDKWATAQSTLLLHSQGLVDLDRVSKAIQNLDKSAINECLREGYDSWFQHWKTELGREDLNVSVAVTAMTYGFMDDEHIEFIASFTGGGEGIDLKPLLKLSDKDAKIVGAAIAELKAVFIDAPTAHDLEGFASMYEDVLDMFEEWLPKRLRNASLEQIDAYMQEHETEFEVFCEENGFYPHLESLTYDYIDRKKPVPAWYKNLRNNIASDDPFKAVESLKRQVNNVQYPYAKAFVLEVIDSIIAFIHHFPDKEAWQSFKARAECCRDYLETDDSHFELGFMLCWGGDGYWWDVVGTVHQMIMETGETPVHFSVATGEAGRELIPLVYERLNRGAALFHSLSELGISLLTDEELA